MPVRLVPVLVQEHRGKHDSASPYQAEGPPHQTAAAHPPAHTDPAVNSLKEISHHCSDKKHPEQLIKTTALREGSCFLNLQSLLLQYRICLFHTDPDLIHQPQPKTMGPYGNLQIPFPGRPDIPLHMEHRGRGSHQVQGHHAKQDHYSHLSDDSRNQPEQRHQPVIGETDNQSSQNSP